MKKKTIKSKVTKEKASIIDNSVVENVAETVIIHTVAQEEPIRSMKVKCEKNFRKKWQKFLGEDFEFKFGQFLTRAKDNATVKIYDENLFKDNIKLTFSYEFLLRLTHNGVAIMTVPKIGYQHVNFREDSLFWSYQNEGSKLSENEAKFWLETSKKEFFFKNKRDVEYVEA
jgi:hypothetical protein